MYSNFKPRSFMFVILCALLPLGSAFAQSDSVVFSGYLENENGGALIGEFTFRFQFYETETSEEVIASREVDVQTSGTFTAGVIIPGEVILLDEAWYDVAIDLQMDGFDEADLFPGRFQMTAVPYALTARPVTYFETHGTRANFTGASTTGLAIDSVFLMPFTTPPGGVSFNRISAYYQAATDPFASPYPKTTFGIYDTSGKLIVSSPVINSHLPYRKTFEVSGRLQASTTYYTAVAVNIDRTAFIPITMTSSAPIVGFVPLGAQDGELKSQIDLSNLIIIENQEVRGGLSICLWTADETMARAALDTMGSGYFFDEKE